MIILRNTRKARNIERNERNWIFLELLEKEEYYKKLMKIIIVRNTRKIRKIIWYERNLLYLEILEK